MTSALIKSLCFSNAQNHNNCAKSDILAEFSDTPNIDYAVYHYILSINWGLLKYIRERVYLEHQGAQNIPLITHIHSKLYF